MLKAPKRYLSRQKNVQTEFLKLMSVAHVTILRKDFVQVIEKRTVAATTKNERIARLGLVHNGLTGVMSIQIRRKIVFVGTNSMTSNIIVSLILICDSGMIRRK